MSINKKLLRDKKRLLCGESKSVEMQIPKEDLAACLSLVLENKSITPESVLIKRMEVNLELMDENNLTFPFMSAILELFKTSKKK